MDELPSITKLRSVAAKMTNNVMSLSMADVERLDEAAALIRQQNAALTLVRMSAGWQPMSQEARDIIDAALAAAREG